jgi:hypothetical protein
VEQRPVSWNYTYRSPVVCGQASSQHGDVILNPMKTPPATPDFARFTEAVREVLKVSKSEMRSRIETHKEIGKRLSKGASLGSAASAKIRSSLADR